MINLSQIQSLQQRLSPQQVQYLKLLQLPVLALEQSIKAELEQNPLLDEVDDIELTGETEMLTSADDGKSADGPDADVADPEYNDDFTYEDFISDESGFKTQEPNNEDRDEFPTPSTITLTESVLEQLPMLNLSPTEEIIGEEIIGNIDPDGYLRRDLKDIVGDLNKSIKPDAPNQQINALANVSVNHTAVISNEDLEDTPYNDDMEMERDTFTAPPRSPAISTVTAQAEDVLTQPNMMLHQNGQALHTNGNGAQPAPVFDLPMAERVLLRIQRLDPIGIASRNLQECLTVQLHAIPNRTHAQDLALRVLNECFEAFARRHYDVMRRALGTTDDALRAALEEIQKLNPKPGNTSFGTSEQTVTPDFIVEHVDDDLLISLNDSSLPHIRINAEYKNMLEHGRKTLPKDTRVFLRQKFDSAKLFITSLQQRRMTMMGTMKAIVELQREFFLEGEGALKPLFYKHVAERVGLDVSTVCRVVNGKYVQCDWGIYELRYFFSDSITTNDGDEVSNRVMKTRIKEMIESEDKSNPLSDEDIAKRLKNEGFNIARRTVAKYREAQDIPVARLRREMA
ncbi:MAG TPA: RNA polymerase factor sigma-54 [Candidatus Kapabacteria bacterium]|nr:RNA polymerase factor sigma-54 [Candidatus Kapabacteria bacterium]